MHLLKLVFLIFKTWALLEEWIEDYYIQLAAYAMAHDALYKTEMQAGIILMASRGLSFQMFTIDGQRLDDYKYKWLKRCEKYYGEMDN